MFLLQRTNLTSICENGKDDLRQQVYNGKTNDPKQNNSNKDIKNDNEQSNTQT